uniref:Secreted protein n=1 Tax=Panagrellus redivivus TaxID=6233 RepID=A0A7E4VAP6_PANRE
MGVSTRGACYSCPHETICFILFLRFSSSFESVVSAGARKLPIVHFDENLPRFLGGRCPDRFYQSTCLPNCRSCPRPR